MLKTFLQAAEVAVFATSALLSLLLLAASIIFFAATLVADFDYVKLILNTEIPNEDIGTNLMLMNAISLGTILVSLGLILLLKRINDRNHLI